MNSNVRVMRLNLLHRQNHNQLLFHTVHLPSCAYTYMAQVYCGGGTLHACLCALSIHAGKVTAEKDAVLFLSNSGNTPECVAAASTFLSRGVCVLVITGGQGVYDEYTCKQYYYNYEEGLLCCVYTCIYIMYICFL